MDGRAGAPSSSTYIQPKPAVEPGALEEARSPLGSSPTALPGPSGKPKYITGRPSNACQRCKSKKIKCSYERPNCAPCIKAKVECNYPSSDKSIWDYARSLEFRLKVLEETIAADNARPAKRQRLGSQHGTPNSVHFDYGESQSQSQRTPTSAADAVRRLDDKVRLGPPSSSQALDRLPTAAVDLAGLRLDQSEGSEGVLDNDHVDFDLRAIPPMEEVERILDYFFDIIHPPHPMLHEPTFRTAVASLYGSTGPVSAQVVYALYVILALHTISQKQNAVEPADVHRQAREYHDISMEYSEAAGRGQPLGRIQGMLLRLLFVLRVPDAGDIWDLTGRTVRAAIDQGLHLDPKHSGRSVASPLEIDLKRRMFWTTYILDRTISIALGRPCGFDSDWISTEFASLYDDLSISSNRELGGRIDHRKETGIHHARYRLIQSDIHARLFAVSASRSPPPHPDWFKEIHRQLDDWRIGYSPVQGEYISDNWIDLHYHLLLSMLYRPSPGNPRPSKEFLTNAVRAAGSIIRTHKTMWRQRAFVNLWLAIHHIFMSGVTYLNCIWNANSQDWVVVPSYVDALLDIQTCSQLLEAMTAKEPGTERMRDAFETVSAAIIRRLSSQTGPLPTTTVPIQPLDSQMRTPSQFPDRTGSFDASQGIPQWLSGADSSVATTGQNPVNMDPTFLQHNGGNLGSGGNGLVTEISPDLLETLESFFSNPYTDLSAFQGVDFSFDGLFGDVQQSGNGNG